MNSTAIHGRSSPQATSPVVYGGVTTGNKINIKARSRGFSPSGLSQQSHYTFLSVGSEVTDTVFSEVRPRPDNLLKLLVEKVLPIFI